MCFYIDDKSPEMLTAKEDITVYKVIYKQHNASVVQGFRYSSNTLYRLRKKLKIHDIYLEISEGFHSYTSTYMASKYCGSLAKVVKFTIPKGAKYYISEQFGEIVSTSIRSGDLKLINW